MAKSVENWWVARAASAVLEGWPSTQGSLVPRGRPQKAAPTEPAGWSAVLRDGVHFWIRRSSQENLTRIAQRLPALIVLLVAAPIVASAQAPVPGAAQAVKTITCSSDSAKVYCDANTHHGVHVAKQRSEAPCTKGTTWDYDDLGIWVDKGCGADFTVSTATAEKSAGDQTCLKAVGKQRSDQLVKQCLQVSRATHPPCNSQNSCELITDEIRRSCAMLGRDAPGFCGEYK